MTIKREQLQQQISNPAIVHTLEQKHEVDAIGKSLREARAVLINTGCSKVAIAEVEERINDFNLLSAKYSEALEDWGITWHREDTVRKHVDRSTKHLPDYIKVV